jgi:uncharacterized membrane protein YhiD involved in acid resistance
MINVADIPKIKLELLGQVNFYVAMGLQVSASIFLGGIVGYERETKMKSAGVKTNILICLGSCVFTAISLMNYSAQMSSNDPNRIAAQIVSGIGFLGAGAIIQGKGGVVGLTTAATIWVVAAIGVTIGMGYPVSAAFFTITVLVVLRIIDPLFKRLQPSDDLQMTIDIKTQMISVVEEIIASHDAFVYKMDVATDGTRSEVQVYLRLSKSSLMKLLYRLRQLKSVKSVIYRRFDDEAEAVEA